MLDSGQLQDSSTSQPTTTNQLVPVIDTQLQDVPGTLVPAATINSPRPVTPATTALVPTNISPTKNKAPSQGSSNFQKLYLALMDIERSTIPISSTLGFFGSVKDRFGYQY